MRRPDGGRSRQPENTQICTSPSAWLAAAALRGRADRPDYRPALAELDIPALVCVGSGDPWSNRAVTAEILACLRNPELLVIDGAAHLPT